jgi:hypothetical protein
VRWPWIQREEPERVRKYHPSIAADLEAIVHKCLEKVPDRRYGMARELAEDLERFQLGEPVLARPVRGWQRSLRWVVRHPTYAAVYGLALVATLLLVIGGIGFGLWFQARVARDQLARSKQGIEAALQAERAEHERQLSEWRKFLARLTPAEREDFRRFADFLKKHPEVRAIPYQQQLAAFMKGTLPVFAGMTFGLMASPLGQGPLLAATTSGPGRSMDDVGPSSPSAAEAFSSAPEAATSGPGSALAAAFGN